MKPRLFERIGRCNNATGAIKHEVHDNIEDIVLDTRRAPKNLDLLREMLEMHERRARYSKIEVLEDL